MVDPQTFVASVSVFGRAAGREAEAFELAAYLQEKMDVIRRGVEGKEERPRTYYCSGKPWYAMCAGRFENALAEWAGGESVNRRIPGDGRPGITIEAQLLNELEPEHIFVSSMTAHPFETFVSDCRAYSIDVPALWRGDIHAHPIPQSDFGGPRWILGLMFIANTLHPDVFRFDLEEEAREFYRRFCGQEYDKRKINRSFGRPLHTWSPVASDEEEACLP